MLEDSCAFCRTVVGKWDATCEVSSTRSGQTQDSTSLSMTDGIGEWHTASRCRVIASRLLGDSGCDISPGEGEAGKAVSRSAHSVKGSAHRGRGALTECGWVLTGAQDAQRAVNRAQSASSFQKGGHSPTSLYFHRLLSEAYQGCPASVVSCSKSWRLASATLSLCHSDIKASLPPTDPIPSHPTQHKPRPYDSTCSRHHHLHEFLLTRPPDPPPHFDVAIYLSAIIAPSTRTQSSPLFPVFTIDLARPLPQRH